MPPKQPPEIRCVLGVGGLDQHILSGRWWLSGLLPRACHTGCKVGGVHVVPGASVICNIQSGTQKSHEELGLNGKKTSSRVLVHS